MTMLTQNLERAAHHLARFKKEPLGQFVNGKTVRRDDAESFRNMTPIDNGEIGSVQIAEAREVDEAVEAANSAFESWSAIRDSDRKLILLRVADAIEAHSEELSLIESMDTGQAIRFTSKAAKRSAENFRFFAEKAPEARNGLSLPAHEHVNYTLRQPMGPVGVITPWNTPLMLSSWKIAPALAAGCTVVHKPAEWSPLTATRLAEICWEAGLPDGVLNVVNGTGAGAGRALCEHPMLRALAFVGGSETGRLIQTQGAATLKRLHLELGGKNPVVVFEDADLDRALDAVVFMIFSMNGERCTSSSRLLIQESIRERFVEMLTERVAKIRVGHPLDPATEIGPLIHRRHLKKVRRYLDIAAKEGAEVRLGNLSDVDASGNYQPPAVLLGARADMRVAQEEIFGPVLTVISFESEEEAIRIANDVDYGLAGYVWTSDMGRGHRMARQLEVGMVWVNSENNRHLPSPFGGMKASGIGRDGGDFSFDFYMETKNVCISLDSHSIPKLGQ